MLLNKYLSVLLIILSFLKLNSSDFTDEPKIQSFEELSDLEISLISNVLAQDSCAYSQMLQGPVLGLLLMVSKRDNVVRQIIMGNKTHGMIFYIRNGDGSFVDRLDPELVCAVENACKSSGARLLSAVYSSSTRSLTQVPGYLIEPSHLQGLRMIHKKLES